MPDERTAEDTIDAATCAECAHDDLDFLVRMAGFELNDRGRSAVLAAVGRLRVAVGVARRLATGIDLVPRHLDVWRDLEAARDGDGVRGSHVAEIWAFRLLPAGIGSSPLYLDLPLDLAAKIAASEVTRILRRFAAANPGHEIRLEIRGSLPPAFYPLDVTRESVDPFQHVIRVQILRRTPDAVAPESAPVEHGSWWRRALDRLRHGWEP